MQYPKFFVQFSTLSIITIFILLFSCKKEEQEKENSASQKYAYTHIALLDYDKNDFVDDQTIVIDPETGTILDLFETGTKTISKEIKTIDMSGKFLIPGLIEGHGHVASEVGEQTAPGLMQLKTLFRSGITTVLDKAGNGIALKSLQETAKAQTEPLSKVYFAALVAGSNFFEEDGRVKPTAGNSEPGKTAWMAVLDDDTDVVQLVRDAKKFGCSALKLYMDITPENAKKIIEAAQNENFPVWSHGTLFNAGPWDLNNINSYAHAVFLRDVILENILTPEEAFADEAYDAIPYDLSAIDSEKMDDYFEMMIENKTVLDATLAVVLESESEEAIIFSDKVTEKAHQKGVLIGAGSDGVVGIGLLKELNLLHDRAKLSNIECLKAATINNAISLRLDSKIGTIAKGKTADLVVLSKNPLNDLDHLKSVERVIKSGYEHPID